MIGRTLCDVTQLLESGDDAPRRVQRVLELLHEVVPYQQCAMLEARLGPEANVVLVPETSPDERIVLKRELIEMFGLLVDPDARSHHAARRPEQAHLAVPLVALDEVIGLLLVQSSVTEYTTEHLSALAVISAKLAAYVTVRRGGADLAELASERDEAKRAVEAADDERGESLEPASTDDRVCDDIERNIQAQVRRLDDLLRQTRLASAELRLSLRSVSPAQGEDPSSRGGRAPGGQRS